jgi:cytidyltransferase-like protein
MKIVVCTGGFDPLHSGHIAYLNKASTLGDRLIVGINSDAWLESKKGRAFMPAAERRAVVGNLKSVYATMLFDDSNGSAVKLLEEIKFDNLYADIIFANGGDRTANNIPEMSVQGVEFVFGVGGNNKVNSSSWILAEWKTPKTSRTWGEYRVLYDQPGTKVKELTIEPGQSLSMQRHMHRAEYWHVVLGQCVLNQKLDNGVHLPVTVMNTHDNIVIPILGWHQLQNPYNEPCRIVEIQYGTECDELDIERDQS